MLDRLLHKYFRLPYRLHAAIDTGTGKTVVLLHGIASDSRTWQWVAEELQSSGMRVVALDLLGHGKSSKPAWPEYDVQMHADALAYSLRRLGVTRAVVVGHSMGGLVAVELAKRHPRLVERLILAAPPIYEQKPRSADGLYGRFYEFMLQNQQFTKAITVQVQALMGDRLHLYIDELTWPANIKSMRNVIMHQTTREDMARMHKPIDIVYGRFDPFILAKNYAGLPGNIRLHPIASLHDMNHLFSKELVKVIRSVSGII